MNFNEYKNYFYCLLDLLNGGSVEDLCDFFRYKGGIYSHIFIIGNGGSASLASHFAQDLMKKHYINAISLTDSMPIITAMANDIGYEDIFSEQLKRRATQKDVLIAISGSGNSPNIIKAITWANNHGLHTIGISGYKDNRLSKIVKQSVCVNADDMETVESIFSFIFHYVIKSL